MALLYFWLGLSITFSSFKGIHKEWKAMLLVTVLQLIIVPLIGLFLSFELPAGNDRSVMIMLALAPGGVTSAIAARVIKLNLAVNVAFSSLTTLLYLFIIQPIFVPALVPGVNLSNESLTLFLFSVFALGFGMGVNFVLPIIAKWLDKLIAIVILAFVLYHIFNEIRLGGGLNWALVLLMIKFHFIVIVISAILASIFFGINRAPLIVLESGFQNVSLIAALGIPLGWSPIMPMIYGIVMFFSAAIMGINVYIIRRSQPKFIIVSGMIKSNVALFIPPFGILVASSDIKEKINKRGLAYWRQFKKNGFLGFYLKRFFRILGKGGKR